MRYAYRDRRKKKGEFRRALDHAHQRRRPDPRPELQPAHGRAEEGRRRDQPEGPRRPRRARQPTRSASWPRSPRTTSKSASGSTRRRRPWGRSRSAGGPIDAQDPVSAHSASVTTGYPDLDALLPRLEAIAALDAAALEAEEIALLGRKSGALTGALKARRHAAGRGAQALRRRGQPAQGGGSRRPSPRGAPRSTRRGSSREQAALDLTMPGRRRWSGRSIPSPRSSTRSSRSSASSASPSRSARKPRPSGTTSRAQLPARPSGDGHARHVLRRCAAGRGRAGRPPAAAHPHLAGADPDHAGVAAADTAS